MVYNSCKADLETRTGEQIVHLGGNPWKQKLAKWSLGKKKLLQNTICISVLPLWVMWT